MTNALLRKVQLSAELSAFLGAKELARTEVTKKIWDYIKANNLQDPKNKTIIRPDAELSKIIGTEPIQMMKMTSAVNKHFVK